MSLRKRGITEDDVFNSHLKKSNSISQLSPPTIYKNRFTPL